MSKRDVWLRRFCDREWTRRKTRMKDALQPLGALALVCLSFALIGVHSRFLLLVTALLLRASAVSERAECVHLPDVNTNASFAWRCP